MPSTRFVVRGRKNYGICVPKSIVRTETWNPTYSCLGVGHNSISLGSWGKTQQRILTTRSDLASGKVFQGRSRRKTACRRNPITACSHSANTGIHKSPHANRIVPRIYNLHLANHRLFCLGVSPSEQLLQLPHSFFISRDKTAPTFRW